MEYQVYYIQILLVDKPDQYNRKGVAIVNKHVKILQELY